MNDSNNGVPEEAVERVHQYKPTMIKAGVKDMHQKDKSKQFVNNQEFFDEIVKFRDSGRISNRLGEIMIMLVERFATQHYYRGYAFKEDMIAEAIAHNITKLSNFDTAKFTNPFSYFTQCTYFSFLNYIAKEKKELYTKYKSTQVALMSMDDVDSEIIPLFDDDQRIMSDFIDAFETNSKQSAKSKKAGAAPKVDVVKTYNNALFEGLQESAPAVDDMSEELEELGIYKRSKAHALFDQDLDQMDLYDGEMIEDNDE